MKQKLLLSRTRYAISYSSLIDAMHQSAKRLKDVPKALIEDYRNSPVKHADETGWRTDGNNGYAWLFCTPDISIFRVRRTRSASVPKEVLGDKALPGILVVDRYNGQAYIVSKQTSLNYQGHGRQGQDENRIHFRNKKIRVPTWNDVALDFEEISAYVVELSEPNSLPVEWPIADGGNGHMYLAVAAPAGTSVSLAFVLSYTMIGSNAMDRTHQTSIRFVLVALITSGLWTQPLLSARSQEIDAPIHILSSDGFVRNWLILGPFPNPKDKLSSRDSGYQTDYLQSLGGEARALLTTGKHAQSFDRLVNKGQSCLYWLYLPEEYGKKNQKWPMILFLHGSFQQGRDLSRIGTPIPPNIEDIKNDFPFVVVTPQCPDEYDAWPSDLLVDLVDEKSHSRFIKVPVTTLPAKPIGTKSFTNGCFNSVTTED